jgi:hypothetical protein
MSRQGASGQAQGRSSLPEKNPMTDSTLTVEELDAIENYAELRWRDPTWNEPWGKDGFARLIAAARAHLSATPIEADVFVQNDDGVGFHKVFSTDAPLPGGEEQGYVTIDWAADALEEIADKYAGGEAKDTCLTIASMLRGLHESNFHHIVKPSPPPQGDAGEHRGEGGTVLEPLTDEYGFARPSPAPLPGGEEGTAAPSKQCQQGTNPRWCVTHYAPWPKDHWRCDHHSPQGDAGECYSDGHDDYKWCSKHNAAWRNGDSNCSAHSPQGDAGEKLPYPYDVLGDPRVGVGPHGLIKPSPNLAGVKERLRKAANDDPDRFIWCAEALRVIEGMEGDCTSYYRELREAQAEIERLRGVLEAVVYLIEANPNAFASDLKNTPRFEIARAALGRGE